MNSKVFKKISGVSYAILLAFCMAMLVVFPERYLSTIFFGIKIWATTVLPSLLPFFFLTALFTKTDTLFTLTKWAGGATRALYRQDGIAAYVQMMSFLSGYPIGVKIVADLYTKGDIDEHQAKKLAVVSSTSGPLFIVGGIGVAMFSSSRIGYILLISHYLSSVILGIIFRYLPDGNGRLTLKRENEENVLYESAYSSVISALIVGAFIAVFYTFANVLYDSRLLYPLQLLLSKIMGSELSDGFIIGLVECTTGIRMISLSAATPISISLVCSLVTLGGLSVWCQSIIYLKKAKVKSGFFILIKFLQAVIAFCLCYLLFCIL